MLFLFFACMWSDTKDSGSSQPPGLTVSVDIGEPLYKIPVNYLSFSVDLGQVAGTRFWNPDINSEQEEIPPEPYDFPNQKLRMLTKKLAPATLRIGGTESDRLYYQTQENEVEPGQ